MNRAPSQPAIRTAVLALQSFASFPVIGPTFLLNLSGGIQKGATGAAPRGPTFEVELVALTKKPIRFPDGVTVHPTISVANATRPDLILIPAIRNNYFDDDFARSIQPHQAFIPWIKVCAAEGARVVSMCTGAFLLAATGLLDGRNATTHWFFADEFRKMYPKVNLHPDRLIVHEGSVITSGAGASFTDLVLYLIELYCGHATAVSTSKFLALDLERRTQLPYTSFSSLKTHDDRHILQIQNILESESPSKWTPEGLARRAGMSLRTFDRRFRKATGEAPSTYIQKLRVEKAKRLLESCNDTVDEIAHKIGYEDTRSFRRLFRHFTSLSPKTYRLKYGFPPACGAEL
jgi:transcriptional regulator GlxA family with amidase domain